MTSRKAFLIFTFLFAIPYLSGQAIIGVAYNAMVYHSDSLWRSLAGAIVGATLLFFAKIPMERPLRILGKYTFKVTHLAVRFFMLEQARPLKRVLNYLMDVVLAFGSTFLTRALFPNLAGKTFLMGTPTGWLIAVMFLSLCVGAYIDFDVLSITKRADLDAKNEG